MKILATLWFLFLLIGPIVCFITQKHADIIGSLIYGSLVSFVWDELKLIWEDWHE